MENQTTVVMTQIAEDIRYLLNDYHATIPTVLEIPSKDIPYDVAKYARQRPHGRPIVTPPAGMRSFGASSSSSESPKVCGVRRWCTGVGAIERYFMFLLRARKCV